VIADGRRAHKLPGSGVHDSLGGHGAVRLSPRVVNAHKTGVARGEDHLGAHCRCTLKPRGGGGIGPRLRPPFQHVDGHLKRSYVPVHTYTHKRGMPVRKKEEEEEEEGKNSVVLNKLKI
jgi:hypothetical protein